MIFDSFLRIIQIWTRNAASHLSMEWWRRKQGSRIDGFVSLSKMSFLRLNKVEFSFSNFESRDFSIFQKKLLARSNFESFSANGEYQVNFELKYFTSLKIVHTFTLTNTYIMFCTVFLDRVLLLVCLYPKQAFV